MADSKACPIISNCSQTRSLCRKSLPWIIASLLACVATAATLQWSPFAKRHVEDDTPARRLRQGKGGKGGFAPSPAQPKHPPSSSPASTTSGAPQALSSRQQSVMTAASQVTDLISAAPDRADALGGFVRLAFHDAASYDGTTGGADGCVDLDAIENRGLQPVVESLTAVVDTAAGNLSKADVWALAANVAIQLAGGPKLDFKAGRIDLDKCLGHGERLPDAEGGISHVEDILVTRLGFSKRDSVALMGAHVLGKAELANSGHNGKWVRQNDRFNNRFFRDLLGRRWNKRSVAAFEGSARTQWNGPRGTMMLNTDVTLAFDTSNGCTRAGGSASTCPRADNAFSRAVTEFADRRHGTSAWHQAFAPAFKKLMALGQDVGSLICVMEDCSTPRSV